MSQINMYVPTNTYVFTTWLQVKMHISQWCCIYAVDIISNTASNYQTIATSLCKIYSNRTFIIHIVVTGYMQHHCCYTLLLQDPDTRTVWAMKICIGNLIKWDRLKRSKRGNSFLWHQDAGNDLCYDMS